MAALSVAAVYYWEIRYLLAAETPGRNELLVGEAISILYLSPFWCGFTLISIIGFNFLSKTKVVISFLPAVLIFLPTLVRSAGNGI